MSNLLAHAILFLIAAGICWIPLRMAGGWLCETMVAALFSMFRTDDPDEHEYSHRNRIG